jgi:hypothetical protein
MKNTFAALAVVLGVLTVTGVVRSEPPTVPCKADQELLKQNTQLLKTITDMYAQSKKEADDTRKKYESLIEKGCK